MIGLGLLIALGPGLTILLAVAVVWAAARRRSHSPSSGTRTGSMAWSVDSGVAGHPPVYERKGLEESHRHRRATATGRRKYGDSADVREAPHAYLRSTSSRATGRLGHLARTPRQGGNQ
jgi:hypothetical protein